MLIQVDVDSTLYPSDLLFAEVAKEFDVKWPTKYSNWFKAEDIGTDLKTLKTIFRRAHSAEYVMKTKPYPGSVHVIQDLIETYPDVEIAFISDRNQGQTSALKAWLEQEGFKRDEDTYVAATKDKREWMRANNPDIVIDDRVRTLLMARFELDAYGVSLEHQYNINLKNEVEGIYLCKDWKTIAGVLEHEVIPKVQTKVKR